MNRSMRPLGRIVEESAGSGGAAADASNVVSLAPALARAEQRRAEKEAAARAEMIVTSSPELVDIICAEVDEVHRCGEDVVAFDCCRLRAAARELQARAQAGAFA